MQNIKILFSCFCTKPKLNLEREKKQGNRSVTFHFLLSVSVAAVLVGCRSGLSPLFLVTGCRQSKKFSRPISFSAVPKN